MNDETLQALVESIKKWQGIRDGKLMDLGGQNCALCQLFYYQKYDFQCAGCPVYETTGYRACNNTPYMDFIDAKYNYIPSYYNHIPYEFTTVPFIVEERKKLAQDEINFLLSLLPCEKQLEYFADELHNITSNG